MYIVHTPCRVVHLPRELRSGVALVHLPRRGRCIRGCISLDASLLIYLSHRKRDSVSHEKLVVQEDASKNEIFCLNTGKSLESLPTAEFQTSLRESL